MGSGQLASADQVSIEEDVHCEFVKKETPSSWIADMEEIVSLLLGSADPQYLIGKDSF